MDFATWLDTFVDEKGIDPERRLIVEGSSGNNSIPVGCLVDAMKQAPRHEQEQIRNKIIQIDFHNGDVMDFFRHISSAIAV